MPPYVPAPYFQSFLDLASVCKNWTQTPAGTDRRMANHASAIRNLATTLNRLLARYPRTMAWMATQPAYAYNGATANPLYYYRYRDNWVNGRTLVARLLVLPRESGTGDAYAENYGGSASNEETSVMNWTVTSANLFRDLRQAQFTIERGAASGGALQRGLSTYNNYTVIDFVLQDQALSDLDTASHDYVDPNLAKAGAEVLADLLEDVRAKFHTLRTENLSQAFCWMAQWPAGSPATPSSSDQTGLVTTSSTYVNILDQTVTARSATSPGFCCPAYAAGRGNVAISANQILNVMATAQGQAPSGTGMVKFEGPLNSVEVTITAAAGVAWYDAASAIQLDTTVDDDDATTARNKIDIFFKVAAGSLYLYGLNGWYQLP